VQNFSFAPRGGSCVEWHTPATSRELPIRSFWPCWLKLFSFSLDIVSDFPHTLPPAWLPVTSLFCHGGWLGPPARFEHPATQTVIPCRNRKVCGEGGKVVEPRWLLLCGSQPWSSAPGGQDRLRTRGRDSEWLDRIVSPAKAGNDDRSTTIRSGRTRLELFEKRGR